MAKTEGQIKAEDAYNVLIDALDKLFEAIDKIDDLDGLTGSEALLLGMHLGRLKALREARERA